MSKNIYVGNLPYSTTDDELKEIFAPFGTVSSSRIITDRYTGRSKGFGFVEMENEEDAEKAINELNGTEVGGRAVKVDGAKPRRNQGGGR